MDCFDDVQIEETSGFDFVEQDLTDLIEEENNFNMNDYLNSNYDYWLWPQTHLISLAMLPPSWVWLVLFRQALLLLLPSVAFLTLLTMFEWKLNKYLPNFLPTLKPLHPEQMTETVNVLPHLNELKETFRRQDFKFTPAQAEQYEILLQARRDRVKYFYETDRVCKISKSAQDKLKEDI